MTPRAPILYAAFEKAKLEPWQDLGVSSAQEPRLRRIRLSSSAVARWRGTGHNFVYADRAGNIGWHAAGLTPIRKNWTGLLPVPGHTGEFEWGGFVPASEMPRLYIRPAKPAIRRVRITATC